MSLRDTDSNQESMIHSPLNLNLMTGISMHISESKTFYISVVVKKEVCVDSNNITLLCAILLPKYFNESFHDDNLPFLDTLQ